MVVVVVCSVVVVAGSVVVVAGSVVVVCSVVVVAGSVVVVEVVVVSGTVVLVEVVVVGVEVWVNASSGTIAQPSSSMFHASMMQVPPPFSYIHTSSGWMPASMSS